MRRYYIEQTPITPEIHFSPDDNIFLIRGTSAPEDVRALYYPVIEWINKFVDEVVEGKYRKYSPENPFRMQTDLDYYNSSSAKFFYDIFTELKRLTKVNIPVYIEWYYDEEDIDQKEAGEDIALLVEMEFKLISKKR